MCMGDKGVQCIFMVEYSGGWIVGYIIHGYRERVVEECVHRKDGYDCQYIVQYLLECSRRMWREIE